jgi:hypothetical protein
MSADTIWAIGFAAWLILLIAAFRYCSGWRSHNWHYGLAPLLLLLCYAPEMALSPDGKAVRELVTIYGFWVAAIFYGVLLIAEVAGRRKEQGLRADG